MSFQPSRGPMPGARPSRAAGPILSVGRRVFVHCPASPGKTVELTDDAGCGSAMLADGTEVEIVAWRPRGATGTRYRVQGTDRSFEGWLGGDNLRAPEPVAPKAPVTAPPAARTVPGKATQRPAAGR